MTKIKTSLKKLIGRIKENMSAFYTSVGAIAVPSAFVVYAVNFSNKWFAIGLLIIGAVALFMAIRSIRQEERKDDAKFDAQIETLDKIRNDITASINTLVNEIRQDRNERRNNNR